MACHLDQPGLWVARVWRVDRHGNNARMQAPEEGGDKVKPWSVDEECTIAHSRVPDVLKVVRYEQHLCCELSACPNRLFRAVLAQPAERNAINGLGGPAKQLIHNGVSRCVVGVYRVLRVRKPLLLDRWFTLGRWLGVLEPLLLSVDFEGREGLPIGVLRPLPFLVARLLLALRVAATSDAAACDAETAVGASDAAATAANASDAAAPDAAAAAAASTASAAAASETAVRATSAASCAATTVSAAFTSAAMHATAAEELRPTTTNEVVQNVTCPTSVGSAGITHSKYSERRWPAHNRPPQSVIRNGRSEVRGGRCVPRFCQCLTHGVYRRGTGGDAIKIERLERRQCAAVERDGEGGAPGVSDLGEGDGEHRKLLQPSRRRRHRTGRKRRCHEGGEALVAEGILPEDERVKLGQPPQGRRKGHQPRVADAASAQKEEFEPRQGASA
eukprot:scaffold4170_cov63-Phaeocystis_antarctica.AAC.5